MSQININDIIKTLFKKNGDVCSARITKEIGELLIEATPNCIAKGGWTERIHWLTNGLIDYPKCPQCNSSITVFQQYKDNRYAKFCSQKCAAINSETKEKRAHTVQEIYGASNVSQVDEINQRRKQTFNERFGGDNPSHSSIVVEKRKQTFQKRFGGNSPMSSEEVREKIKCTNLERYGVEYTQQSPDVRAKTEATNIERYGGIACTMSAEILKNRTQKWLSKRLSVIEKIALPLFALESYTTANQLYRWKCKKCDNEFESDINHGGLPDCLYCNPRYRSKPEHELKDWLIKCGFEIKTDRKILNGFELDILIEKYQLAIEHNGLYYHSELGGNKDSKYHLNKTQLCRGQGISLLHIFGDEWMNQRDIIQSLILSKLGITEKIGARQTIAQEISMIEANNFLNKYHLQGASRTRIAFGLFYENELVSVMTFAKPRFDHNYQWEMIRYATINNMTIVGGASKLLKKFEGKHQPTSLISYADLRFSTGNVYSALGFTHIKDSNPGYFYLNIKTGYNARLNRLGFQKKMLKEKLEIFDSTKTEWENMIEAGYDRIWDCGQSVWVKTWL